MRALFIGDIVGSGGRDAVKKLAPSIMEEFQCSICIANGENMAAGNGFSKSCLNDFNGSCIDVFTGGDHTWDQKDFVRDVELFGNLIRPANVSARQPGKGYDVFTAKDGTKFGVISLLGRTFMGTASNCPFQCAIETIDKIRSVTPVIFVDFHAEATSDKIALGRYLDGKVTAVLGTHTHVPTADEQILDNGTAYITDVGMVGARRSILGRDIEAVVSKYVTGMPSRFNVVNDDIVLNAVVVTFDETGKAGDIIRISRNLN